MHLLSWVPSFAQFMKRIPQFVGLRSLLAPVFSIIATGAIFGLPERAHASLSVLDHAKAVPGTSVWGLMAFGAAVLLAHNRRGHLNRKG